jgi:hypothetical protein
LPVPGKPASFGDGLRIKDSVKSKHVWCIVAVFWALAGCRQAAFTPDSKFVDLYVELKLATLVSGNDLDKANEMRRVILAQHHVTPAKFHASCVQLQAHPEAWREFQEQVVLKVDEFKYTGKGDSHGL